MANVNIQSSYYDISQNRFVSDNIATEVRELGVTSSLPVVNRPELDR
jgi:hypothetical protein